MYDLTIYFAHGFPAMMARKSIDTVLLSVAADKLSQREWGWIKLMNPSPAMVTSTMLESRHDAEILAALQQEAGN